MESPLYEYQEELKEVNQRIQELELELAYKEYELIQYRTIADKHECSSPKELDAFIDQVLWQQA